MTRSAEACIIITAKIAIIRSTSKAMTRSFFNGAKVCIKLRWLLFFLYYSTVDIFCQELPKITYRTRYITGETEETDFKIQEEEIEECGWFDYDGAMKTLNYENDKRILFEALEYLKKFQNKE